MRGQVAGLCEHDDEPAGSTKYRNCLNASFSRTFFHAVLLFYSTVSIVQPAERHCLIRNGRDLEGSGHILVGGTVPSCLGGTGKEHENFQIVPFGCGIRT